MWRLMVLGLLMIATGAYSQPAELKIPTQRDFSPAQRFFTDLLQAALIAGGDGRTVPVLREVPFMEQERVVRELQRGQLIDVHWFGTTREREQILRAIPIPLMRGLLGYRRFIIRKDMVEKFDRVKSLADLSQFIACQGLGWPDVDILRSAGLRVVVSSGVENIYLFRRLASGRCDYFPRGYFEPYAELAERSHIYPDMVVYPDLILHYPFPVYFFVNKNNELLAQWIQSGLERMIDSGEFARYLEGHAFTHGVFPLTLSKRSRLIEIPNPYLPEKTNINDRRYWIAPEDWQVAP